MSQVVATLRRSRRFPLLLGVIAVLFCAVMSSQPKSAIAATSKPFVCDYYYDAAHTQYRGTAWFRCNGSMIRSTGDVRTLSFPICQYDLCCGNVAC